MKHESPWIYDVHLDDFYARVIEASHDRPMLVDFWADWCGPCHALAPHLYRVVDEYEGALELAKLEVDEGENMKLAGHYRVRGFPTVILFRDGKEVARFASARATQWIRHWIEDHIG